MWSMAGPMLSAHAKRNPQQHADGSHAILDSAAQRSDEEPPSVSATGEAVAFAASVEAPRGGKPAAAAEVELRVAVDAPPGSAAAEEHAAVNGATRPPTLRGRATAAVACVDAVLNRPLKASVLGLVVGCTPLRHVLSAEGAPLRWVLDGMLLLGNGAVPTVLFTLGANLSNGPAGGAMPLRTTAGCLVAKLVVVPISVLALLVAAVSLGLVPRGDGLLPLTMLICGASPTAMNISMIATLQGTGVKEVASVMFWMYVLSIATVSLVASCGLLLFV